MPVILVTDSSGKLSKYRLEPSETPYTLGRSEDCHISLPDEAHLSRVHCLLTAGNNGVELRDNNSSNGIFDNGRRISSEPMQPGKEYSLGNCILCLRPEKSVTAPAQQQNPNRTHQRRSSAASSHPTSVPGSELGLPTDFGLELRLLTPRPPLSVGGELRFGVKADCAAYVCLVQYDCNGTATLLVPGCDDEDVRLHAGTEMQFPRAVNNEYLLVIEPPVGKELIIALACTAKLPFDKLWLKKLPQQNEGLTPGQLENELLSTLHTGKHRWASAVLHLQTELSSHTQSSRCKVIKTKKINPSGTMGLK